MKSFNLALSLLAAFLLSNCQSEDDMRPACAAPEMPSELPMCFLSLVEELRAESGPDVTYKADLYQLGADYYYAILSSEFSDPITIYNACCSLECSLGLGPGMSCEVLDDGTDLGRVWEE